MKNKNGTKQGRLDCVLQVCCCALQAGERLTVEDMVLVTVGFVSIYTTCSKTDFNPVGTLLSYSCYSFPFIAFIALWSLSSLIVLSILDEPQVLRSVWVAGKNCSHVWEASDVDYCSVDIQSQR